jgi:hypothetical protein
MKGPSQAVRATYHSMKRCAFFISLALVVALGGCSGGGTVQKTFPPCDNTPSTDSAAHLVAPASGTTGVSPTVGSITVAYGDASVLDSVSLAPSDGSTPVAGNPSYTGSLPQSGTVAITIPPLKPATTYAVTGLKVNFAHLVGCFAPLSANFGSFTTL